MKKLIHRILAAGCVLFTKRVIVVDAHFRAKKNQMELGYWTTIDDKDEQILYMDQMTKTLEYEKQENLRKERKFNPQSN